MSLDERQVDLFSRQILLREVGGKGQERLLASRVLVLGSGPAAETAATYLAGAGVGTLGVEDADGASGSEIAFAPLAERCPDARLVQLDASAAIDLAEWDVVIDVGATAPPAGRRHGRPRLGSVAVGILPEGSVTLLAVPSATGGCTACHEFAGTGASSEAAAAIDVPVVARDSRPAMGVGATAIESMLAGDMAALAACALALGLDTAPVVHALRIEPGAPAFAATAFVRRAPCPRGCGA